MKKPILFGAKWCAGCKSAKAYLDNKIDIVYVDVDEDFNLAQKEGIRSIPTLITDNGNKIVGLENILNANLS